MWKCKKCGGEVIAETEIHTTIDFRMNRNSSLGGLVCGYARIVAVSLL